MQGKARFWTNLIFLGVAASLVVAHNALGAPEWLFFAWLLVAGVVILRLTYNARAKRQ